MWARSLGLTARPANKQVAGLGNHGLQGTRHNVGMAVLAQLAQKLNVTDQWRADRRCCADVAVANLEELDVVLLKPRRLMNVNGLSIANAGGTMESAPASVPCTQIAWSGSGWASAALWEKLWWITSFWAGSPLLSKRSCHGSWSRQSACCWSTSCGAAGAPRQPWHQTGARALPVTRATRVEPSITRALS
ncbi:probable peptidyl-tRNA hydrolase isoform X2 [Alligator sinensis]|uniref:Probable peptidyl-tRNA hydrolase isoform X2 n=1 Tax=Alligator sinensis TaxID=38654 RepID=A0A3Q0GM18_ALLSI|nr:probable peptidyl-tRNA hydrolase isoform X2 [Alligator sinensis]